MRYEIEACGRVYYVLVARTGRFFAVSVDGRPYIVDAAPVAAHTLSLIVDRGVSAGTAPPAVSEAAPDLVGAGRAYETVLTPEAGTGRLIVGVGPFPVAVILNGRRTAKHDGGAARSDVLRIVAPMPGRVVRVLVQPGQTVSIRQPVVVVEAMKMENALRADRDGTVVEVHAREGVSVEAGAPLVVIR